MLNLSTPSPQPPHVMAVFNDGADSFLLSRETTLAELAEYIDDLASRHDGAAVAINIHFDPPGLRTMARKSSGNPALLVKPHARVNHDG